jgi:hypothetical protein
MPEAVDIRLPDSFGQAIRQQLRLTLSAPYETPITVAVNGALMSSAWFFLPTDLRDKIFTLHGTLAFALILAAWMYSDVPSTNVFANDGPRIVAALDDPVMFRRLLYAKNVTLWLLITPICALAAIINGLIHHSYLSALFTIVAIGVLPFGFLAISAWVGILFPYHAMPLRYRWEHRRPARRKLFRWGVLIVTPYGLLPVLSTLMLAPSLLLWGFTVPHGLSEKVPDHDLGLGIGVACVLALICTVGGHRIGGWMARKRRPKLVDFLSDPTRG